MPTTHKTGNDDLQRIAHEAMLQRGLLPDFSPAVIAETNQITQPASPSGAAIRDLRGLLWASIDNDDSRDLDQLSVAEPVAGGAAKILVAIADVDALVKKDCAIDGHASTNTTSVYTTAEIFSMLPEKLSTNLTSLAEGQERLAIVIEIVIAIDGAVTSSGIYRDVVLNRAKLAYNGVAAGSRHGARAAKAGGRARTGRTATHPGSGSAGAETEAPRGWSAATGYAGSAGRI
jgi:exoribonuclease-2